MEDNYFSLIDAVVAEEEEYVKECIAEGKIYYVKNTAPHYDRESFDYYKQKMQELKEKYSEYFNLWDLLKRKRDIDFRLKKYQDELVAIQSAINDLSGMGQKLDIQIDEMKSNLANRNEQGKTR